MPIKGRAICDHARRGSRSCPFATLIGASERARKVKQIAPISVSNGHALALLRAWPQTALPLIGLLGGLLELPQDRRVDPAAALVPQHGPRQGARVVDEVKDARLDLRTMVCIKKKQIHLCCRLD